MDTTFLAAPQFTAEDEEREIASLTEEEKKEAHNDLYGVTSPPPSKEAILSNMQQLETELEKIDVDNKKCFLRARSLEAEFTTDHKELMLFVQSEKSDIVVRKDTVMQQLAFGCHCLIHSYVLLYFIINLNLESQISQNRLQQIVS